MRCAPEPTGAKLAQAIANLQSERPPTWGARVASGTWRHDRTALNEGSFSFNSGPAQAP
jgi:hypothetical protein